VPDLNGDRAAWTLLTKEKSLTVGDFAKEADTEGRLTVTTHHSSKGRQFAGVIIPELIEEVFPAAPWDAKSLLRERRLFYVAFTRAKRAVVLVFGNEYIKKNKALKSSGASRFCKEIHTKLKESGKS